MSKKSHFFGKAYEYACLKVFAEEIAKKRTVEILKSGSFEDALESWQQLDEASQKRFERSARAAMESVFSVEPRIFESDNDELTISLQKDERGVEGDVRDLIIARENIKWEIGFSLKHNHFAVKHSRLGRSLDFCKSWFGQPCSNIYWQRVKPVFAALQEMKETGKLFSEIESKEETIYQPILEAFKEEVICQYKTQKKLPALLVEYLLGRFDFYKIISVDTKELTIVQSFNLHGQLNQNGKKTKATVLVPITALPKRIISFDYKPDSKTTLELYLDGGWQFTFRIHNASTRCEPSLKFDIQIVGMPTNTITLNSIWK